MGDLCHHLSGVKIPGVAGDLGVPEAMDGEPWLEGLRAAWGDDSSVCRADLRLSV